MKAICRVRFEVEITDEVKAKFVDNLTYDEFVSIIKKSKKEFNDGNYTATITEIEEI